MYCHELKAIKGNVELDVSCEDTPDGYVGIWPYILVLESSVYEDLLKGLRSWSAANLDQDYRLYVKKDQFEANH